MGTPVQNLYGGIHWMVPGGWVADRTNPSRAGRSEWTNGISRTDSVRDSSLAVSRYAGRHCPVARDETLQRRAPSTSTSLATTVRRPALQRYFQQLYWATTQAGTHGAYCCVGTRERAGRH